MNANDVIAKLPEIVQRLHSEARKMPEEKVQQLVAEVSNAE